MTTKNLLPSLKKNKRLGRDSNEVVKYREVGIDDQSFETQRNLETDFAGSFKNISVVISRGMDNDDEDLHLFLCIVPFFSSSCGSIFLVETLIRYFLSTTSFLSV